MANVKALMKKFSSSHDVGWGHHDTDTKGRDGDNPKDCEADNPRGVSTSIGG